MNPAANSDSKSACFEKCETRLQECRSEKPSASSCEKQHRKCLTECELVARGIKS